MSVITQDLRFRVAVEGAQQAESQIKGLGSAVQGAEKQAAKASTGGFGKLGAAVQSASGMMDKAGAVIGKVTGALGVIGVAIGGAVLAFNALKSVVEFVNDQLGEGANRFRVLTEESVKAKTGLTDLSSQMSSFAKELGLANESLMTFEQHQAALKAIENGGGAQTASVIRQRAEAVNTELAQLRAALAGGGLLAGAPELRQREKELADEAAVLAREGAAIQGRMQREAAGFSGSSGDLPDAGGGGGRTGGGRRTVRGGGGTFFGAGAAASQMWAGMMEGPAYGPSDDPVARRLAKMHESPTSASGPNIDAEKKKLEATLFLLAQVTQASTILDSSVSSFGQGMAQSAANAILFGESFSKGINQAMKALAAQALAQSLWEGAQALGALALGRPDAAALHWEAAAMYTGVAGVAALGAAASGGLRSGKGSAAGAGRTPRASDFGSRNNQSDKSAKQEVTIYLDTERMASRLAYSTDTRSIGRAQSALMTRRG